MISCFDASVLILLFDSRARAPTDRLTGEPVTDGQERVRFLLHQHARTKGSRIIIPTPVLGEFLVRTKPELTSEYLGQLQRLRGCRIAPFAERAAIEFADMQRSLLGTKAKPRRSEIESRAKAKFDQQVVAIARAEGVTVIYTDDRGLAAYGKRFGIDNVGIAKLPLPPDTMQGSLPLEPPETTPAGPDD